jgi:hypothetical protein
MDFKLGREAFRGGGSQRSLLAISVFFSGVGETAKYCPADEADRCQDERRLTLKIGRVTGVN